MAGRCGYPARASCHVFFKIFQRSIETIRYFDFTPPQPKAGFVHLLPKQQGRAWLLHGQCIFGEQIADKIQHLFASGCRAIAGVGARPDVLSLERIFDKDKGHFASLRHLGHATVSEVKGGGITAALTVLLHSLVMYSPRSSPAPQLMDEVIYILGVFGPKGGPS